LPLLLLLLLFGRTLSQANDSPDEATLDAAKSVRQENDSRAWYDVRLLGIDGQAWRDVAAPFDRLPARAEPLVRKPVWDLSRQSAGLSVRFVTDATEIAAHWVLTSPNLAMPHMPATGVSGLDLYVRAEDQRWRWLANGRPQGIDNRVNLVSGLPPGRREYLLYLPLYNGVKSVELGIPPGFSLAKAAARPATHDKPLVFWGTSITQGGCASRPGMVHTAILGRRFDRDVINLGFSGNGKMEPELARLVAEIDAAVYVIDCLPNMSAAEVQERVEPLVKILRAARPATPILLAEDRTYSDAFLLAGKRERNQSSRAALRAAYERLKAANVPHLYHAPGEPQLGDDNEGTVDSSHPTDLGFQRMADFFERELRPLVK